MKEEVIKFRELLFKTEELLHLSSDYVTDDRERANIGVFLNGVLEILWRAKQDKEKGTEENTVVQGTVKYQGENYQLVNRQARQGDIVMFNEDVNLFHSITDPNTLYKVFEGSWGGLLETPLYKTEGETWSVYGWGDEEVYVYEKCKY